MPDPVLSSSDAELRQHVQRVLSAHYEVDREIGRGGMGIVYLARDTRLKRPVAVKLLPPELAFRSEIRTRFLREAETAAQLSHPNIVPIYSVDEREGLVYFIMGYIDGGNLAVRLQERGSLEPERTRQILCEVSDALAYAHARGVVHRDIKPDNILLCGDDGRAVVTDFGIARAITDGADSRLTATGMAIGTPTYMSPEQAAGEREIDGRSDLYSLGVVGYQMLVGEPPFTATSTPALLVKHLSATPRDLSERRPDAPADLARSIMILLEKDPANRYPSAAAFVRALETHTVPAELTNGSTRPASGATGAAGSGAAAAGVAMPVARAFGASTVGVVDGARAVDPGPTAEEMLRWEVPAVRKFRKEVVPFLFVNAVIVLFALFGGADFLFVTAIWSIMMAYKYAKLWSDGYDWHDVFKQPHDRMMFDVAAETIDDARALFDPSKREQVRERARTRRRRQLGAPTSSEQEAIGGGDRPVELGGEEGASLRRAAAYRSEIRRTFNALPKEDRKRLPDVVSSAEALYEKVRVLAHSVSESRQSVAAPDAAGAVEREIQQLESEANPLDLRASDDRVRRLAYLKRQRRALIDAEQRRERDAVRLENCVLALQSMQLDLKRLQAGNQTPAQLTLLAERAMSLAHDVDGLVLAEDLARSGGSAGSRRAER
ncbi:MAG: serine/threonine-protein kinase [Gemmatimonadaceae bacterium]